MRYRFFGVRVVMGVVFVLAFSRGLTFLGRGCVIREERVVVGSFLGICWGRFG